jgi:hypothetical protein
VRRRRAQRLGMPAAAARLHRRPGAARAGRRIVCEHLDRLAQHDVKRSPSRSAARRRRSRRSATASAISTRGRAGASARPTRTS